MTRLRHVTSGAVVSVPDEKAARMGTEWAPVVAGAEPKKAAARRSAKK